MNDSNKNQMSIQSLIDTLKTTTNKDSKKEILLLLIKHDAVEFSHDNMQTIAEFLRDPAPSIRARTARFIGHCKATAFIKPLSSLLKDQDSNVRNAAAIALNEIGPSKIVAQQAEGGELQHYTVTWAEANSVIMQLTNFPFTIEKFKEDVAINCAQCHVEFRAEAIIELYMHDILGASQIIFGEARGFHAFRRIANMEPSQRRCPQCNANNLLFSWCGLSYASIEAQSREKQDEIEKQRKKEEERKQIEDKQRLAVQHKRKSRNQCIMCGDPLGFFHKILKREKHSTCTSFRFDESDVKHLPNKKDNGLLCPYCGKSLNTSLAKQCFHCHMDWHDLRNVIKHDFDKKIAEQNKGARHF